jgi:hypothetical protein
VALNTITLTHSVPITYCFRTSAIWERTARSYAYGSGIYIYICTHCHSLFRLWVRFSYMVRCTRYILYYEAILITVVLELLPLFWYVAHEKRENHFNFDQILFRLIMMLNSKLHRYQVDDCTCTGRAMLCLAYSTHFQFRAIWYSQRQTESMVISMENMLSYK